MAEYPDFEMLPEAVTQLSLEDISVLMHKVKDEAAWLGCEEQAIEQGWSRQTLERYVKDALYQRQTPFSVNASNCLDRLFFPQSTLAQELLQQPYNFDLALRPPNFIK